MPESYEDQLSRVERMIEDDGDTWDLSPNDKAALAALLQNAKRYEAMTRCKSYRDCVRDFDGNYVFTFKVPGGFSDLDAAVDSLIEKGE